MGCRKWQLVDQGLKAVLLKCSFILIKLAPGHLVHPAGLGNVAWFFQQVVATSVSFVLTFVLRSLLPPVVLNVCCCSPIIPERLTACLILSGRVVTF